MSFRVKQDYFGLSTGQNSHFVITSSDENKSASTAQAQDDKGDVVAIMTYGETSAPSCSYVLSGDASTGDVKLGDDISSGNKKYVITDLSISTGAGTPPSITVSGEEVPDGSHCSLYCYYNVPSETIDCCHHAQALFGLSWTGIGTGFYVTQANYSASCELTKATKDGETVSYDITNGTITAQITIQGTGTDSRPSFNAPTGWVITSPLSLSNPDSGYDTWSISLQKTLSHATPAVTP